MQSIALLTDYGSGAYAGGLSAALRREGYRGEIIHFTHQITPFNIWQGAFLLEYATQNLPEGAIILPLVDPGVGSSREVVYAETGNFTLLAPNNGILTPLAPDLRNVRAVDYIKIFDHITYTFHGRDVFAPLAAYVARAGIDGILHTRPVKLELLRNGDYYPHESGGVYTGKVMHIDPYGNCISNFPREWLAGQEVKNLKINGHTCSGLKHYYAEVPPGEDVLLVGSYNKLELAINQGDFAQTHRIQLGEPITMELQPAPQPPHSAEVI
mgnify:CR=1 FL=1